MPGLLLRRATLRRATSCLTFCALLLAPACAPAPDGSAAESPAAEAQDGEFVLRIAAPRTIWAAGEPIEVTATLSYEGPLAVTSIGGAGAGPIAFSVVELNGTRRLDGIMTADCAPHEIGRQAPIVREYVKSGAINPGDLNEAFYRTFLDDPEFRLPSGRWQVIAWAAFQSHAGCEGRSLDLRASLILMVK